MDNYKYSLSLLGLKNLLGLQRIHWYEREDFLDVATKIFDYLHQSI